MGNNVALYTDLAKSTEKRNDIVKVKVKCTMHHLKKNFIDELGEMFVDTNLVVYALYSKKEKVGNIQKQVIKHMNKKYKPIKLTGFFNGGYTAEKPITEYDRTDIINNISEIWLSPCREHKVKNTLITCKYMEDNNTNDPLECPIYYSAKQKYEFNEASLHHLLNCQHFNNEFEEKPRCKFGQDCYAYIRQEKGGNRLADNCHMKIYRHPPRNRNIKLSENVHSLVINKHNQENSGLYRPTKRDKQKYGYTSTDGYLSALIEEVMKNGYKYDLCTECSQNEECKHNEYSILKIVDKKLQHIRHKEMDSPLQRDEMLSLILYTGCECNYDLCASQRNGNYDKWKWFDYCLYEAIEKLGGRESGTFSVYTGLNKVKLDKQVSAGYFVTYVSSSWREEVATSFMDDDGMIIHIGEQYKSNFFVACCDVSWISKFPDECEILLARSVGRGWVVHPCFDREKFKCVVLDESKGIQKVSLEPTQTDDEKHSWREYKTRLALLFDLWAGTDDDSMTLNYFKKLLITDPIEEYMTYNNLKTFLNDVGITKCLPMERVLKEMRRINYSDNKISLWKFQQYFLNKDGNVKVQELRKHIENQSHWILLSQLLNRYHKGEVDKTEFGKILDLSQQETNHLWNKIEENNGEINKKQLVKWFKTQIKAKNYL